MRRLNKLQYGIICTLSLFFGLEFYLKTRIYVFDIVVLIVAPLMLFLISRINIKATAFFVSGILMIGLMCVFDIFNDVGPFEIVKAATRNLGYILSSVFGYYLFFKAGARKAISILIIISVSYSLGKYVNHYFDGLPLRYTFKYGGGYFIMNSFSIFSSLPIISTFYYIIVFPIIGIYYKYRGIVLLGIVSGIFPLYGRIVGGRKGMIYLFLMGILFVFTLYGVYEYLNYQSVVSNTLKRDDASTNARINMILDATNQFLESPILGNGAYSQSNRHFDALDTSYSTGVHSVFFQLLAEYGILGGLFAASYHLAPLLVVMIKKMDRIFHKDFLGRYMYSYVFLLVFSGYGFFSNPFSGFSRNIFGITVGIAIAILADETPLHNKLFKRRWRRTNVG